MTINGAIIAQIRVKPHPNADKLALGIIGGTQVVVDKSTKDGDIGVFFSSELKVSEEYAKANKLRKIDGGFFPDSLKVRPQKFRGERSDGYFAPLSSLSFTGVDISTLDIGDVFTNINKIPICEKYYTPATRQAMGQIKQGKAIPSFPKHFDTEQLALFYSRIPEGSLLWYTLKVHGTSQRTGLVPVTHKVSKWYHKVFPFLSKKKEIKFEFVSGTRNTVLDRTNTGESGKSFRFKAEDLFKNKLHQGEIIYYEVVGWENSTVPIMARHNFSNSSGLSYWGDNVVYSYGNLPGQCSVYVYRITRTTLDCVGNYVHTDLSWPQVKQRCYELGVEHVPEFQTMISTNFIDDIITVARKYDDGPDPIDNSHPREGVVVHVLTPSGKYYALKHKGFTFKVGEGLVKESDSYVDLEEVS